MKKIVILCIMLMMIIGISSGCGKKVKKIKMPYSSEEYCDSYLNEWTVESLKKHFKELGFEKIEAEACKPDDDNYDSEIFNVFVKSFLDKKTFKKGDTFKPNDTIIIYYNSDPVLTVDNCKDLETILTSDEMGYMEFANKYDGKYVDFTAKVKLAINSDMIEVQKKKKGLEIKMETRDLIYKEYKHDLINSLDEGDKVSLTGQVDASWSDHYNMLYMRIVSIGKR